jgi:hypothetical protein
MVGGEALSTLFLVLFRSDQDFVEMLVGRGAARVRELFTQVTVTAIPVIIGYRLYRYLLAPWDSGFGFVQSTRPSRRFND